MVIKRDQGEYDAENAENSRKSRLLIRHVNRDIIGTD